MKRFLIVLGVVLLATNAFSAQITFDSTATATRSWLNAALYETYNRINTGMETDNIADLAVASDDIATSANPLVRDAENVGEYVYTGFAIEVPSPVATTVTLPSGTAYIQNDGDNTLHRVVMAADSKDFTGNNSKDAYVYLDFTGNYNFQYVANGATQPSDAANSIILAKCVLSGTSTCTSVTDLRVTAPPSQRIYLDYIKGATVSRDTTDTDEIVIAAGEIEFGSANGKIRRNTATTTIDFGSTGEGGLDVGAISDYSPTYFYLFGMADSGNAANFKGIASISSTDASGVTGERLIGWCYAPDSSNISPDSVGSYKAFGSGSNFVSLTGDTITFDNGDGLVTVQTLRFYTSGRPVSIKYSSPITISGASPYWLGIYINGTERKTLGLNLQDSNETHYSAVEWNGILDEGEYTIEAKSQLTGAVTMSHMLGREFMVWEH